MAVAGFLAISAWLWVVFGLIAAAVRTKPGRWSRHRLKAAAMVDLGAVFPIYYLVYNAALSWSRDPSPCRGSRGW